MQYVKQALREARQPTNPAGFPSLNTPVNDLVFDSDQGSSDSDSSSSSFDSDSSTEGKRNNPPSGIPTPTLEAPPPSSNAESSIVSPQADGKPVEVVNTAAWSNLPETVSTNESDEKKSGADLWNNYRQKNAEKELKEQEEEAKLQKEKSEKEKLVNSSQSIQIGNADSRMISNPVKNDEEERLRRLELLQGKSSGINSNDSGSIAEFESLVEQ